jgi:hypothetical protein
MTNAALCRMCDRVVYSGIVSEGTSGEKGQAAGRGGGCQFIGVAGVESSL